MYKIKGYIVNPAVEIVNITAKSTDYRVAGNKSWHDHLGLANTGWKGLPQSRNPNPWHVA
jgi:hypothetical protein